MPHIDEAVKQLPTKGGTLCDIFSGTGAVARHFKNRFALVSNDLLYFSYVLQYATIQLNQRPDFAKLKRIVGDPLQHLNSINPEAHSFNSPPLVAMNYSPYESGSRMYFTERNALKIDAVRQTLQDWRDQEMISEAGYMYLLAALIESVPSISNIAGTYGAYLKHWDARTAKPLKLEHIQITDNSQRNCSYNRDANDLISDVKGEILYIDPPYNGRQYLGNYHVLESIALYDDAELKGKTGVRQDVAKISSYCKRGTVSESLNSLLANAEFDFVVMSYSSEGLLSEDELVSIVERHSKPGTIQVNRIPYRRYSRIRDANKPTVHEILISSAK